MSLIFRRLIQFGWFCLKWGLLLGAIGAAVAAFYFYYRVDEEIRCYVVQRIADHYRGLKVTIRSAGLVEEGIDIRGLSILQPGAEGPQAELAYFDEILLRGPTDWRELVRGQFEVRQITIRRPTLRVTRRPDGTFSTSKLLPLPKFSQRPPPVSIVSGTIEIFDPLKNPTSTFPLRDVNLTISVPDPSSPTPNVRKLKGTLSADHVRWAEVEGTVDAEAGSFTVQGTIDGVDVSPEMRDALPEPLAARLAVWGRLRGQAALGLRLVYDPAAEIPCRFDLSGRLVDGRLDDPRLPSPLTDIRATFHASNDPSCPGFTIEEMVANLGPAKLQMSVRQAGFDRHSPRWVEGRIDGLQIDQKLAESLPAPLPDHWHKYRPTGRVDVRQAKLYFDGQKWHPERLSVQCKNVSFTHHQFNYRLHYGRGPITLTDDFLDLHLKAYSGSQEVRIDAEMHNVSSSKPYGLFRAEGNRLQLDAKLLGALKPNVKAVVRSLNPYGTINFRIWIWREGPEEPLKKHLEIDLNRCSLRYEKFPYPLSHIEGTIVMRNDHWWFHGLRGRNDTGWVTCEEGFMTPPAEGQQLFLRLTGTAVPLEPELRDALPGSLRRLWNDLQPQGMINLVTEVRYLCPTKELSVGATLRLGVSAEGQSDARPFGGGPFQPPTDGMVGTTSITPVHFPYRMEKLRGVLEYRDGHVTLHQLKAEHGRVTMTASGDCLFRRDGSWDLQLQPLTVDRLRLDDRELIQALPGRLKKAILELKPTGPINLRGSFGLEGGAQAGDPVRSRWDLAVELCPGDRIDCGVKLENLQGSMTLNGAFNGRNFHCRGELDIDALTYKDYQFTEVRGPFWIDDRQALFGSWVGRRRNQGAAASTRQKPRPLTAKLFGGTVTCDPWVAFGERPRYGLQATLSQADLSRWAQEAMVGRQDLTGTIYATVDLGGTGRSLHSLGGHGQVHLRDADIYELPLMIALLKILSIREPDTSAFSKSDIDFRIQGNHIYFPRIDFNGDAISLLGQGEMDFEQNVALNFHAVVGNDEVRVPIVRELLGGASQQIMQICVRGNLQNPQTEKVAFPGVNQALQQIQDDLQKRSRSPRLFPQAQPWMPQLGSGNAGRR